MKQIILAICVTVLIPLVAFSQQPTPTPRNDEPVVKVRTDLIQLDVTVTDNKGNVVTGLRSDDFEIFENGEKQKKSNFSFLGRTIGGASVSSATGQPGTSSQLPPKPLGPSDVRLSIAIVVDDLNLSFGSIYYTRRALRKFVDEQMQPGDLVAIIRTGGGVGALQQFTSDKRLLNAAIDKIRWNPFGGSFDSLSSVSQNDEDVTDRFTREADGIASGDPKHHTTILTRDNISDKKATDYHSTKNMASQEGSLYQRSSLGTIQYVISGMSRLPGRRSVMLFSDGLAIGNDSAKAGTSKVLDFLRDVTATAKNSSVVVNTFDTKGMRSMSISAADNTYEVIDGHRGQKERERTKDFKDSQDGLAYFADQTGGKALLNSDDLNGGMQRALDAQGGFYLLAYEAGSEAFDAEKRKASKIEVRTTRPGLNVNYRSDFFTSAGKETADNSNLSVEKKMANALTSPFTMSEITLNINALYADDPVDGPYIRSFLHIDAKNLMFIDDKDGWKKATFDVAAVAFCDNGQPAETKDSKYTIRTKGATYDTMLKNGVVYVLMVPVKRPCVYQYRVALRDEGSGRIGSASHVVEVPDLMKKELAVSSLAVEGVTPSIWQNITQGKIGNNPGQIQVASTLLYDTVLGQFVAGNVLRYGYEVYNAKLDGKGVPHVETQVRILQNDKAVVEGAPVKFDPGAQTDMKRLKISGAALLRENLPVGDYVLQVIVNDTSTKKRAVQLFPFEIIK